MIIVAHFLIRLYHAMLRLSRIKSTQAEMENIIVPSVSSGQWFHVHESNKETVMIIMC